MRRSITIDGSSKLPQAASAQHRRHRGAPHHCPRTPMRRQERDAGDRRRLAVAVVVLDRLDVGDVEHVLHVEVEARCSTARTATSSRPARRPGGTARGARRAERAADRPVVAVVGVEGGADVPGCPADRSTGGGGRRAPSRCRVFQLATALRLWRLIERRRRGPRVSLRAVARRLAKRVRQPAEHVLADLALDQDLEALRSRPLPSLSKLLGSPSSPSAVALGRVGELDQVAALDVRRPRRRRSHSRSGFHSSPRPVWIARSSARRGLPNGLVDRLGLRRLVEQAEVALGGHRVGSRVQRPVSRRSARPGAGRRWRSRRSAGRDQPQPRRDVDREVGVGGEPTRCSAWRTSSAGIDVDVVGAVDVGVVGAPGSS